MENMKQIFNAFIIGTVLLMMTACGKASFMRIDDNQISISMKGGSHSLIVHSDVYHLKTLYSPSWATVSFKDSIMIVDFEANTTGFERKDYIVISNGELTSSIHAVQATRATCLMTKEDKVTINKEGDPCELDVYTDGYEVTAEVPENVKVDYHHGKLFFSNEGNSGKTRRTKIQISCDDLSKEIALEEEGDICPSCNGKGIVVCWACGGSGELYFPYRTCEYCRGRGKTKCPECGGKK